MNNVGFTGTVEIKRVAMESGNTEDLTLSLESAVSRAVNSSMILKARQSAGLI